MSLKISSIEIENIGCLEKLDIKPDVLTTVEGRNGCGKSTVLNAIRSLIDTGHDPSLLRKGSEEGSVRVTLSDGVTITEVITPDKTTRQVRHPQFGKISKQKEWIESVINSVSFEPALFLTAKPADRLAIFLRSLPIKLSADQLRFLPVGVVEQADLDEHPLNVIGSKNSGLYGLLYKERAEVNRLAKDKRSTAAEMSRSLPEDAPEGNWADVLKQRRGELNQLKTDTAARANAIKKDAADASEAEKELARQKEAALEAELQEAIDRLKADTAIAVRHVLAQRDESLKRIHESMTAELDGAKTNYDPNAETLSAEIARAQALADQHLKAESTRELIIKLGSEASKYEEQSKAMTAQMDKLEALKASLLANLPIEGMEITDGKLMVNGIEFDRINDSEKHRIAVEIMRLNHGELGLMVLDRAEIFDSKSWVSFKRACRAAGVPIIAARVTDSDLTVTTEGREVA